MMLADQRGMELPDSGRLAAAEKTLQKMEHEIKLAECVALTHPIELGWLGGACNTTNSQGPGSSLWRCNKCRRLVLAWRAPEHKLQCVPLPGDKGKPAPAPKAAASGRGEQQASQRKTKSGGQSSGGRASSKLDESARLTKLYRTTYPHLKPGESMTDDLLAGFSEHFNFTHRKPRTKQPPRRKRLTVDLSWLWAPVPLTPPATKSQASKQASGGRSSKATNKGGSKQAKGGSSMQTVAASRPSSTRGKAVGAAAMPPLPPLPPQPPSQAAGTTTSKAGQSSGAATAAGTAAAAAANGGHANDGAQHGTAPQSSYLEAQQQLRDQFIAHMQAQQRQQQQQQQQGRVPAVQAQQPQQQQPQQQPLSPFQQQLQRLAPHQQQQVLLVQQQQQQRRQLLRKQQLLQAQAQQRQQQQPQPPQQPHHDASPLNPLSWLFPMDPPQLTQPPLPPAHTLPGTTAQHTTAQHATSSQPPTTPTPSLTGFIPTPGSQPLAPSLPLHPYLHPLMRSGSTTSSAPPTHHSTNNPNNPTLPMSMGLSASALSNGLHNLNNLSELANNNPTLPASAGLGAGVAQAGARGAPGSIGFGAGMVPSSTGMLPNSAGFGAGVAPSSTGFGFGMVPCSTGLGMI